MVKRQSSKRASKHKGQEKKGPSGPVDLTADEISNLSDLYRAGFPRNQTLLDEVVFILTERTKAAEIKIHGIEKRIKELPSVLAKCRRGAIRDLDRVHDIVGARVICLFRPDMDRVGGLIGENFDVVEVDDKLAAENNPLGYLSVHYRCKMPARYKGPRYENTADLVFEIQVRTLCMHAWAAVSHYLDYKGDWDVPANLKRALSALSGLFYVADNEFEQFYAARQQSMQEAKRAQQTTAPQEINFDSVAAYLPSKFADRGRGDAPEDISAFVNELKTSGYATIADIDRHLDLAADAFKKFEATMHEPNYFTPVGSARMSLCLASDAFYKTKRGGGLPDGFNDPLLDFRVSNM